MLQVVESFEAVPGLSDPLGSVNPPQH